MKTEHRLYGSDQINKLNHRIEEIECLRAVAIIFTLIHHGIFFLILKPTPFIFETIRYASFWGGVDLFFVISGFVIMRDFASRVESKEFSYWRNAGAFWLRRAWRILPSAWLWLAIYLLATLYFNSSGTLGNFENNFADSVAAFFQFANFHQYQCFPVNQCGPNGVYWSLSLEEQFYILLPIAIFLSGRYLRYIFVILLLAQFFIPRPVWSFGWAIRTDTFMWGCLLAIMSNKEIYRKLEPKFLNKFGFLKWLFIPALIIGMAVVPAVPNGIPLATSLLGLVCAALVFLASYDRGYFMTPNFLRKILVWLGSRSYSLYLIHIIVFRATIEFWYRILPEHALVTEDSSLRLVLSAIPVLLIVSELNYRFFEQPLRRFGRKMSSRFEQRANRVARP